MPEYSLPMTMSALACALAEGLTTAEVEQLSAAFVILSDSLAAIALCRSQNEN